MEKKKENENIGFHFAVTEQQVRRHQKLTVLEIFEWLESMNAFLYSVQTPEERKLMRFVKGK